MTSSSSQGVSVITANLRLNHDPAKAMTEINTKVNAVLNQLPPKRNTPHFPSAMDRPSMACISASTVMFSNPTRLLTISCALYNQSFKRSKACRLPSTGCKKLLPCGHGLTLTTCCCWPHRADVHSLLAANNFSLIQRPVQGTNGADYLNLSTSLHSSR